ncbi:MAG: hypothetical protein R3304_00170 [Longimicrobiales bacterium]|nr:hypothetical protein [Longimicrobiales bacterium]
MNVLLRGLTERTAATSPDADDHRLRGRTYTIPFEGVWQASLRVIRGKLRGWTVVLDDDRSGRIDALHRTPFRSRETEVTITIGLDENGQTRMDATTSARTERGDWGRGRRLIGRFTRALDRELNAGPGQILDSASVARARESA